jgi:hypothetical protein
MLRSVARRRLVERENPSTCATVVCRRGKSGTVLQVIVITTCKRLINPITNPNPFSFTNTRDNMLFFQCVRFLTFLHSYMSIVSVMVPYVLLYPVFNLWIVYPELLRVLLFLIACIYSLCLVWNILSVCPVYFSVQSRPLLLYLSVRGLCFTMFYILFCVLGAAYVYISLNSFLFIFPLYVEVAHFVFWCWESMSLFCFCGEVFYDFLYYSYCYVVCFYKVNYFSLASLDIGTCLI